MNRVKGLLMGPVFLTPVTPASPGEQLLYLLTPRFKWCPSAPPLSDDCGVESERLAVFD